MVTITKTTEPLSLARHRRELHASYDNYKDKNDVRDKLLAEQGYICCYCMRKISKENMKIEHRSPQNETVENDLCYRNLFAACKGNEGRPKKEQTCDTRKGEEVIEINPLEKTKIDTISYQHDGSICSTNTTYQKEIDKILNLNFTEITRARKTTLDEALKQLSIRKSSEWNEQFLQKMIDIYIQKNNGMHVPHYAIVVQYLTRKLSKLNVARN